MYPIIIILKNLHDRTHFQCSVLDSALEGSDLKSRFNLSMLFMFVLKFNSHSFWRTTKERTEDIFNWEKLIEYDIIEWIVFVLQHILYTSYY